MSTVEEMREMSDPYWVGHTLPITVEPDKLRRWADELEAAQAAHETMCKTAVASDEMTLKYKTELEAAKNRIEDYRDASVVWKADLEAAGKRIAELEADQHERTQQIGSQADRIAELEAKVAEAAEPPWNYRHTGQLAERSRADE